MTTFQARHRDLVSLLDDCIARFGNRPLFGTKRGGAWTWLSYAEFGALVDRCRSGLAACGVGRGDRVAVISNNRVEWAAGAYATYGLGAAWVPMYEAQQAEERRFILEDCGAKVVFVSTPAIARGLEQAGRPASVEHVFCFDAPESDDTSWAALLARGANGPAPTAQADPASIAGFIYTAGTTGRPKGVLLSHENLASNVDAGLAIFPLRPEHRSLSFLPWAHSFGQVTELHTLIGAGASIALAESIPQLLDNLAEVKPSVLMAVPSIFNRIYDKVRRQLADEPAVVRRLFATAMTAQSRRRRGEPLPLKERMALAVARRLVFSKIVARFGGQLQFAISGGAPLPVEVAEFVDNLGIMVCEGYGLTETSPVVAGNTPYVRRIGSVGKPLPGVTVHLDESAGGDGDGEIVVYGHNVMLGYHGLPAENARVFTPDGGLRTGDLGRFDDDGFLYVTGRIKEIYKLANGKYVAPAALESQLQLSSFILQAVVYGDGRPANVAVIVPDWERVKEWAGAQGLASAAPSVLARDPRVRALLAEEIRRQTENWRNYEKIRDFIVAAEEFSIANDMLTPKLSTKRRNVVRRFQAELDALYAALPATLPEPSAIAARPPEATPPGH